MKDKSFIDVVVGTIKGVADRLSTRLDALEQRVAVLDGKDPLAGLSVSAHLATTGLPAKGVATCPWVSLGRVVVDHTGFAPRHTPR